MGPVNWLAVVLAAGVAVGLAVLCYGSLARKAQTPLAKVAGLIGNFVLFMVPATMLGHNFARIGVDTLAARPWLYFMMSGGLALAIIIPLLTFTYARRRLPTGIALADSLFALAIFLTMGTVFWIMS
jgi:hypothetical protein